MARIVVAGLIGLVIAGSAAAQAPLRFAWQPGQTHTYAVRHVTTVTETARDAADTKPTTVTAVTTVMLSRQWTVKAVDAAGVATLEMAITRMKQEHTRPGAEPVVLDSATAEGAKAFGEFLGKPIVTAKIDATGQLLEAKSSVGEAAAQRLQAELPFRVVLPEAAPAVNAAWDRRFTITLDPPLGTGETYPAKQTYTFRGLNGPYAVIGLTTTLTDPPSAPSELQPLVSWLWEGDVFFDTKVGRYHGSRLTAKTEIANHQGEGTKFVYQSEYTEAVEK